MAFTAKILSWRFHHLNIVGCLLKRRPTKGGSWAPQDPPPPSYAPVDNKQCVVLLVMDLSAAFVTVDHKILLHRLRSAYVASVLSYGSLPVSSD